MKEGRFKHAAQALADQLPMIECSVDSGASSATSMSVKVSLATACMLSVVSDAYDQSRYSFSGEILDDFVLDLFYSFPMDRRLAFAQKADSLLAEILSKQGIVISGDTWLDLLSLKSDEFLEA
jgi:hypothetical protein